MAIIKRAQETIDGLTTDLSALESADITLQSNIDSEVTRATVAETGLQNNIDAEEARAIAAEGNLTLLATTDKTSLVNAINEVHGDIAGFVTQAELDAEEAARIAADAVLDGKIADLSGVTDAATARTNLGVYSTTEVDNAISVAGLALGTNYSTANATAAATDFPAGSLSVGDNIFVIDDGDTKWAIYKVIAITDGAYSTSTLEKIMDEDVYLNAQSATAIKASYESNADTNAFTDAEKLEVGRIGDNTTVLTTTATEILPAINELDADIVALDIALRAYTDQAEADANTYTDTQIATVTPHLVTLITESLLVSGDTITLTHAPKDDVVLNFGTVRHINPAGNAFDIPVSKISGTDWLLSANSAGQFNGETVVIQYGYLPTV